MLGRAQEAGRAVGRFVNALRHPTTQPLSRGDLLVGTAVTLGAGALLVSCNSETKKNPVTPTSPTRRVNTSPTSEVQNGLVTPETMQSQLSLVKKNLLETQGTRIADYPASKTMFGIFRAQDGTQIYLEGTKVNPEFPVQSDVEIQWLRQSQNAPATGGVTYDHSSDKNIFDGTQSTTLSDVQTAAQRWGNSTQLLDIRVKIVDVTYPNVTNTDVQSLNVLLSNLTFDEAATKNLEDRIVTGDPNKPTVRIGTQEVKAQFASTFDWYNYQQQLLSPNIPQ